MCALVSRVDNFRLFGPLTRRFHSVPTFLCNSSSPIATSYLTATELPRLSPAALKNPFKGAVAIAIIRDLSESEGKTCLVVLLLLLASDTGLPERYHVAEGPGGPFQRNGSDACVGVPRLVVFSRLSPSFLPSYLLPSSLPSQHSTRPRRTPPPPPSYATLDTWQPLEHPPPRVRFQPAPLHRPSSASELPPRSVLLETSPLLSRVLLTVGTHFLIRPPPPPFPPSLETPGAPSSLPLLPRGPARSPTLLTSPLTVEY